MSRGTHLHFSLKRPERVRDGLLLPISTSCLHDRRNVVLYPSFPFPRASYRSDFSSCPSGSRNDFRIRRRCRYRQYFKSRRNHNLRIASMGIAAYEYVSSSFPSDFSVVTQISASYLITLPAEFRLYKASSRRR
jgi:hypothetical protein